MTLPKRLYETKAEEATSKSPKEARHADHRKIPDTKKKAVQMCQKAGLERLAKEVKSATQLTLKPFISVKTHKDGNPFRVIVEDRTTWQRAVAFFLQQQLAVLPLDDPFQVKNSDEVVDFLSRAQPLKCLSIDVTDLFYNVPQRAALQAVEERLDAFGVVKFQNQCGLKVTDFLNMFSLYLESLFVKFRDSQRKGICIGSCVAPALCDTFLASSGAVKCFRYVHDFLVCFPRDCFTEHKKDKCLELFRQAHQGLEFTVEMPSKRQLAIFRFAANFPRVPYVL